MTEQGSSDPIDEELTPTISPDCDEDTAGRWWTASSGVFLSLLGVSTLLCSRGFSRRGILGTIGVALASALGIGTVSGDETDGDGDDNLERYVVGLESGTSAASVSQNATQLYRSMEFASAGSVVVGAFDDEMRQDLEGRSDVRYVERDHVRRPQVHSAVSPSEAVKIEGEQRSPWGVERIGATDFHGMGETGDGATVAILDSGIDPEHECLEVDEGKAFAECNGAGCATDWDDESGHGTHCAGTVGALDNGVGVIGVVPEVNLCALKVLASDGSGYDSDIAAAIEWCGDNDVDVINLSLGGSDEAQVLEDAIEYAYERGVLVVAAAGNEGSLGGVDYPAGYEKCIAVGATNDRDEVPDWSARGDSVELVAPGEDVLSTRPGDEYTYMSGTSMAAPHVAAIGAQLMSRGLPHVENTDDVDNPGGVRGILQETADDLGFDDDEQGYGLLNAFDALEELEPVVTEDITDIRADTATFNGSVRSLEDADTAAVSFQWRDADSAEWTETESETLEGDTFSTTVDGLDPDTAYDVRALVDDDGETTRANVETFRTGLAELAVEIEDVDVVDHRSATVAGNLKGMGDTDSVAVSCSVRVEGDDEWEPTESQSLEAIGAFEDTLSSLEPETEYEVRAVAESGEDRETGDAVAFETDPEPGLPAIDRFELADDSTNQFVRCNVHWGVSDRDDALELVATELRYADEDDVLHRVATEIEAGEESGVHTVRHSDRLEGAGEAYDVTLSVTDSEGNVTEETDRITLDERSPAPSIDQFEVTIDDFLGSPEAVVEWAVSDEGGELDGVVLELHRVGDSEVVDDSSSMARDEEASGTDSLRDRDGDGSETEYEVTITATDYFEQTTEETTRVTFGE